MLKLMVEVHAHCFRLLREEAGNARPGNLKFADIIHPFAGCFEQTPATAGLSWPARFPVPGSESNGEVKSSPVLSQAINSKSLQKLA